ncbi:MAG: hypothetical protein F6K03_00385 [Kamptonema sp. SIO4C4]|nr:hypothetical protein [Kamptonema sp. SIO4C4]
MLETFTEENQDANSPLTGQIDTSKLGLLGHSLGGAVGLSAIANQCLPLLCSGSFQRPPELMAGIFFGANLRNPKTDEPIPIENNGIDVALLQGEQDGRAQLTHAEATFENIATPSKALIVLTGVNHFGITNVNSPSGAIPDPNEQTLAQPESIATLARWSGVYLRGTLLDDEEALAFIFETGEDLDPNVSRVEAVQKDESACVRDTVNLGLILGGFAVQHEPSL